MRLEFSDSRRTAGMEASMADAVGCGLASSEGAQHQSGSVAHVVVVGV